MTKRSSLMSKVMVLLLAFAVVFTYSVMPMNQAYAASAKKPAKVTIKSAKATSATTVQVKWKKAKNAKKYEVYYSTKSKKGFKKGATVKGKKKVTAVVKNLKPSTKYYFKVRAVNGKKKGKFSKVKAATTKAAPKPAPAPAMSDRQVFVDAAYVKKLVDSGRSDVVIAEVSWGPIDPENNPEYKIPGAIHVNTDDLESNKQDGGFEYWDFRGFNNNYKELIKAFENYGITKDTELVCYGASGTDSAPTRLAMAAVMLGVKKVRVLDGGLPAYGDAYYKLTKEYAEPKAKSFGLSEPAHPEYVISTEDMLKKVKEDPNFKLVSIRAYDEFIGMNSGYAYIDKAGEPLGAVWGHDTDDGSYFKNGKTVDTNVLNEYLKPYGASTKNELAFYCGTGWRATIPFLICYEEGIDNMKLWDDGWFVYSGANTDKWNGGDGNADAVKDNPVQIGDPAAAEGIIATTVGDLEPKYCPLRELSVEKASVVADDLEGNNFTILPPKEGVINNVKFSSSDESVATVDAEGKVTIVDASKTKSVKITAETNATWQGAPAKKASYTLVVNNGVVSEKDPTLGEEKSRFMTTTIKMVDTKRYPKGKVVEVWVPVAHDALYQTATEPTVKAVTAAEAKVTTESQYGNKMVYIKWDENADPATRTAEIIYQVSRKEVKRENLEEDDTAGFSEEAIATLSEESRFVKVSDPIVIKYAEIATEGKTGTLEKAYGVYEWILNNLARIDNGEKIGNYTFAVEGCGYGDTVKILKDFEKYGVAGGHCTDINSTFVALCRAAGVPAREMFGIRLADDATGGQHCWAEFYLPGTGWVFADPADVLKLSKPKFSDKVIDMNAWKAAKGSKDFADNKTYYWGSVDNNRVVISNGRDVTLEPAQKADPRNTFGYPYAEVDGMTAPDDSYRNVDAEGKYIDCTVANDFRYEIKCTVDEPADPEVAKTITAEELMAGMIDDSIKILDLRNKDDYNKGHIVTAAMASVETYVADKETGKAAAVANLKAATNDFNKDTKYALICYSGRGYANAGRELLLENGINNDNILILAQDDGTQGENGGMVAWEAKYPASFLGIAMSDLTENDFLVDVRDTGATPAIDAYSAPVRVEEYGKNLDKAYTEANGKRIVIVCYPGNALAKKALLYYFGKEDVDMNNITYLIGGAGNFN